MSLTEADAARLTFAGFLQEEIDELANAKTSDGKDQPSINLDSPTWQTTMKSRKDWWIDKVNRDWTEEDIHREILMYYEKDNGRSPFDFVRAAGSPAKERKQVDYIETRRRKMELQIKEDLGKGKSKKEIEQEAMRKRFKEKYKGREEELAKIRKVQEDIQRKLHE